MPNTAVNTVLGNQVPLQVAVGIVKDCQGQVLVALRPKHVHQGELWEFPGGKVDAHESVAQALARELKEELGIIVHSSTPLITIRHQYPDLSVQLNVCLVEDFSGTATGCEGQQIQWVKADDLRSLQFPAANVPIIAAATLPEFYAILDSSVLSTSIQAESTRVKQLLDYLQRLLHKNIKLIQIRLKQLPENLLHEFLILAQTQCSAYGASLLINSTLSAALHVDYGVHLTSNDLMRANTRPECSGWVAASCHNRHQLQHATAIGVDFVVLAPVLPTPTHPQAATLGWSDFEAMLAQVNIPVYALGGMRPVDLDRARMAGAQGLSGIRLFLD